MLHDIRTFDYCGLYTNWSVLQFNKKTPEFLDVQLTEVYGSEVVELKRSACLQRRPYSLHSTCEQRLLIFISSIDFFSSVQHPPHQFSLVVIQPFHDFVSLSLNQKEYALDFSLVS